MTRRRTWVIAAVCGVLCAVCIALYAQSLEQKYAEQREDALERFGGEQVGVCVATRDIVSGEELDQTNTTVRPWLAELLPEDAVEDLSSLGSTVVSEPIYAGEPIVEGRTGTVKRHAMDVPEGFAAVSVAAQDVSAVGGSIAPGVRVDVYAASEAGADVIARDVLVLETSSNAGADASSSGLSWVTLSVEPSFVEELIAASQRTKLYFAIPNGTAPSKDSAAAEVDRNGKNAGSKKGEDRGAAYSAVS